MTLTPIQSPPPAADRPLRWQQHIWPFSLYSRWRAAAAREQVEDALKLLLDLQWESKTATPAALKAGLSLSDRQALRLIDQMAAQGLLRSMESGLALTPEGERWALQIVRAHRLWERYLADEARMPLDRIHREAHHREHGMTAEQTEALEAALGFPSRDPHGDPIPSSRGPRSAVEWKPLTNWPFDVPGKVIHIEDEPPIAYAQILAEGITLNQVVRVVENTPSRLLLSDGENEYRLAPAVAANVFLEPVSERAAAPSGWKPLSVLRDRQKAQIVALDDACQGFTRRRFLDLGLTPGTTIHPELSNAFGDPRAYRVRGTLIALRKEQASQIWVKTLAS
jgi:DtxR family Mn-dependent transcriptional regulator